MRDCGDGDCAGFERRDGTDGFGWLGSRENAEAEIVCG